MAKRFILEYCYLTAEDSEDAVVHTDASGVGTTFTISRAGDDFLDPKNAIFLDVENARLLAAHILGVLEDELGDEYHTSVKEKSEDKPVDKSPRGLIS